MKNVLLFLLFCIAFPAYAQYEHIKTEVLDTEERSFKPFFSQKMQSVRFSLIRKTTNQEVENYVQVEIGNLVATDMTSTSGMIIANGIESHSSTSVTMESRAEIFLLRKDDLGAVREFLNTSIRQKAEPQTHTVGYSIKIEDKLTITLLYDTGSNFKWKYLISILDVQFDINFDDGLSLMKKLVEYQSQM